MEGRGGGAGGGVGVLCLLRVQRPSSSLWPVQNEECEGTALACAKRGGHAEVAELLRAAGARDDE